MDPPGTNNVVLAIGFCRLYNIVEPSHEVSIVRVDMKITNMVCDAQPHLPSQLGAQLGQFTDLRLVHTNRNCWR